MLRATTLCLLLTLLVACGEGAFTKPPAQALEPEPVADLVGIEVEARLPGTSAVEMEEVAALPLEKALSAIEGVERTTTTCEKGQCVVRLTLVTGSDVAGIRDHVRTRLLELEELPKDAEVLLRPQRAEASRTVLLVEPTGRAPALPATLRRVAEAIVAPWLKEQRNVSEVEIRGGRRPQCLVLADANRLAMFDVTPLELAKALESQSLRPGGAGLPRMNELIETVVTTRGEEPVRLDDVAEVRVELTNPEPDAVASVSILVTMRPGTSAVDLQARIADLEIKLPQGVRLRTAEPTRPTIVVWIPAQEQQQRIPLTQQVRALVRDVPGVKSATPHLALDEPEVVVELRQERLSGLGVTNSQVAATIQLALDGRQVGIVRLGEGPTELIVRVGQPAPRDLDGLMKLRIRAQKGEVLPLSAVARPRLVQVPSIVFRLGSRRAALVKIQTTNDANTESVVEAVRQAVAELNAEIFVEWHEHAEGR